MPRKGPPYITIEAEAPLDPRWDAGLWFAWSRILGQCRLKRACKPDTWPAAVLRLRTIQAAAILAVHPNKVRWMLDRLAIVASMSARCTADHAGDMWTITVDNYAKYQKLGRPTSDVSSAEVREPPHVPTSPRPHQKKRESAAQPEPEPEKPARSKPRKARRDPLPEGFPDPLFLLEIEAEFPDLALADAIAEFVAYAKRDGIHQAGENGWRQALRGALLRDRGRGLFVRRASKPQPGARIPARSAWEGIG